MKRLVCYLLLAPLLRLLSSEYTLYDKYIVKKYNIPFPLGTFRIREADEKAHTLLKIFFSDNKEYIDIFEKQKINKYKNRLGRVFYD